MNVILFVLLSSYLIGHVLVAGQVLRNTYCYGDSSHANNLLDISCPNGQVIRMLGVIAATKPSILGCPSEDHNYTPAEQDKCCTYNASDCMGQYTGNVESYYNCTGKTQCFGVPIVWQPSGCNSTTHPPITNYLILEYNCVTDGLLNGACTTTQDCLVNNTVCSNSVCLCESGYSEYNEECFQDGAPNGGCLNGNTCSYENAYCSTIDHRCRCPAGYIEDDDRCIKISSGVQQPGYCYGDSSNANNRVDITCTSGVIHVLDILVGAKPSSVGCPAIDQVYTPALQDACCTYNETTDCIVSYPGETEGYYLCNGKVHCAGLGVVQVQTDCPGPVQYPRFSNYLVLEFVCVPEGEIHGHCDESEACVDRNSECFQQLCQCVDGFSDRDHVCWLDGTPGVECSVDGSCLDPNSFCSNNTCTCNTGFTLLDGACAEYCTSSSDCSHSLTVCEEGKCVCIPTYSLVYGECKQDEEVGGRCSYDGTCRDVNAECDVNNVCVCTDGYSLVDDVCKLDGSTGGQCGTTINITCTDENAQCSPVDRGMCECIANYQEVSGTCKQDGCVGCACQSSNECTGSNSECGSDSRCQCVEGYTEVGGACQLHGSVDGVCLPDFTCLDPQAVCINRKCVCNDVKHYKHEDDRCVREEGYLNGQCRTSTTLTPCIDVNAHCASQRHRCACNNGFFEVNGVCKLGNTSSVTSCAGTSPYNTLAPDCDRDSFAVEVRTYRLTKLVTTGCSQFLNIYNHTYYQTCCTQRQTDCSTDDISQGLCSSVYYKVAEYVCMSDDALIDADKDNDTTGPDCGITIDPPTDTSPITDDTPIPSYNCSIQASCLTDINVYVLLNRLQKVSGVCTTSISITGDGQTTEINCDGPPSNHYTSIFNVASGFVAVRIEYKGRINGAFSILFRATNRNALLTGICGIGAKTTGISNLRTCGDAGQDNKTLDANDDDETTGRPEVSVTSPDPGDSSPGLSGYMCSVEASCTTTINVYVLVNTIERINDGCSCNITLTGDRSSSLVTCDYPRPSYYNRVFSVSDGFVTAQFQYIQRILGHFTILFRASHPNAFLTLACGTHAKSVRNPNTRSCDRLGSDTAVLPSVGGGDGESVTDIFYEDTDTNSDPGGNIGRDVYHCSVQASCLTSINVFVLVNTLQEVNGICSCNISILSGSTQSEVTCRGPAANAYTPIMVVTSGFARVDISHLTNIRGSFTIRFEAVNKNTKLVGYCDSQAKTTGISSLQACPSDVTGDNVIEADSDDEVTGPETIITTPDYPSELSQYLGSGPSVYTCSVRASCTTDIHVFVLVNTLQKNSGICSCNVTIHGDGRTTSVTCDGPIGNYFRPIGTFTSGYMRLDIHYNRNIYGRFAISFRATHESARLTAGCGRRAQTAGVLKLPPCTQVGKDGGSIEVHTDESMNNTDVSIRTARISCSYDIFERNRQLRQHVDGDSIEVHTDDSMNNTDVSITTPGYTDGGTVPTTHGIQQYSCTVQASCFTDIDVFVLVNTLQKFNEVCSCNISMTSGGTSTDVNCDGPAQNRYTSVLTATSGFINVNVDYRKDNLGDFVIEFRAVNRNALLYLGCGTSARQTGSTALPMCPKPLVEESTTIEVDVSDSAVDTEVIVTNPGTPGSPGSGPWPRDYWCSVQTNCSTDIEVYVMTNNIQEVNGACTCIISLYGSVDTDNVTCYGPGSNLNVPILIEPSGFLQLRTHYPNGHLGFYDLKFVAPAYKAVVNVSCGIYAALQGFQNDLSCEPSEGGSTAASSSGGTSLGLIIGIVVVVLLLLVLFVLACVFRDKIRSKLCPDKSKIEPVEAVGIKQFSFVDPSPSNKKFTPRPDLERPGTSVNIPDLRKQNNIDGNINLEEGLAPVPIVTGRGEDTVVRTKFQRRPTLGEELAQNARINEEIEHEREEREMKKERRRLRKLRNAFSAVKAFQLPSSSSDQAVGTYRPLSDTAGVSGEYLPMNQPPLPFIQSIGGQSSISTTRGPPAPLSGPGLPDFSGQNIATDHPRPSQSSVRLPPLKFHPAKAWKLAGNVTAVVTHPNVKKKKSLDIANVDEPGSVEHNSLE